MTDSPRDDLESLPEGIEALRALVLRTIADRDATLVERDAAVCDSASSGDPLRRRLISLIPIGFSRSDR